jgi:transposase
MIRAVIERCAGIDVGKRELAVTVLTGAADVEPEAETRVYTAMTGQLEALRQWLTEQEVTDVVMESTGSYWKPVMNILEPSVRVWIAQPQAVKNLRGHKTDMKDSHWLAHLLRHNMIRPSFIPPRSIRELRDLTRRRKKVLGAAASEKNRVMKVLEDASDKNNHRFWKLSRGTG